jgi:hypothetical protein
MLHSEQQLFPVLENERLVGAVTLSNLHAVPEEGSSRESVGVRFGFAGAQVLEFAPA